MVFSGALCVCICRIYNGIKYRNHGGIDSAWITIYYTILNFADADAKSCSQHHDGAARLERNFLQALRNVKITNICFKFAAIAANFVSAYPHHRETALRVIIDINI